MRKPIVAAVVVAVLGAAALIVWRWPRPIDASVFVGQRVCAVQLADAAMPELLRCDQVVAHLKSRVPAGANIALGHARGSGDARARQLDAALRAAGYRRTVSAVTDAADASTR